MPRNEKYAELTLHWTLCSGSGGWEGRYDPDSDNEMVKERYYRAMKTVREALITARDPNSFLCSSVHIGYDPLIDDIQQSTALIRYAEKNIPGAVEIVEPIDYAHGRIGFYLKIRFDGWTMDREAELVELLLRAGVKPYKYTWDKDKEDREFFRGALRFHY